MCSRLKNDILVVYCFLSVLLSFGTVPNKAVLSLSYFQDIKHHLKLDSIITNRDIRVADYFQFIDSIVQKYDSITPYKLTEHLLVGANPWILDTLIQTDYYVNMERKSFVYNQKELIVLRKGQKLFIPDSASVIGLQHKFKRTWLDVNIPEFKLRIYEGSEKMFEFDIRVGRNEQKYLEMSGRIQDLKTKAGNGFIVSYDRNPKYVNPVTNLEYFVTTRDDNRVTKLPQIPFIETQINGVRHGQLIHATTNPVTLGKAYSNGCIGASEKDTWIIYYNAPIGTPIRIRYDLHIINDRGERVLLEDIYLNKS